MIKQAWIALRNIEKSYLDGDRIYPVLTQLNLDIDQGDFMAITGPSGSGKSTLLNILGLLDLPDKGHLLNKQQEVDWSDELRVLQWRKETAAMVFQQFHLLPHRSVYDNINFGLRYLNSQPSDAPSIEELLALLGLHHVKDKAARLLSGGEMQRVALARALIRGPKLILADEPTGNLDTQISIEIMKLFKLLQSRGYSIILSTHDLQLLPYCNRHLSLEKGALKELQLA